MRAIFRLAVQKVGHGVKSWWQRVAMERELSALPNSALKDLGFDRSEIPILVKYYLESSRLRDRMLARIGIDAKQARRQFPELMNTIRKRCGVCSDRNACRRWLDFDETGDGYRLFCSNAMELDAIRDYQSQPFGRASVEVHTPAFPH